MGEEPKILGICKHCKVSLCFSNDPDYYICPVSATRKHELEEISPTAEGVEEIDWTKEPPSEPGYYWFHWWGKGAPQIIQKTGLGEYWHVEYQSFSFTPQELAERGEWWPERIKRPPKKSTFDKKITELCNGKD